MIPGRIWQQRQQPSRPKAKQWKPFSPSPQRWEPFRCHYEVYGWVSKKEWEGYRHLLWTIQSYVFGFPLWTLNCFVEKNLLLFDPANGHKGVEGQIWRNPRWRKEWPAQTATLTIFPVHICLSTLPSQIWIWFHKRVNCSHEKNLCL